MIRFRSNLFVSMGNESSYEQFCFFQWATSRLMDSSFSFFVKEFVLVVTHFVSMGSDVYTTNTIGDCVAR